MPPTKRQQVLEFCKNENVPDNYLCKLLFEFIDYHQHNNRIKAEMYKDLFYSFGEKFNDIKSESDFTERLFFNQVEFFKNNFYKAATYGNMQPIEFIVVFYRFLLTKYSEFPFFQNSKHLTRDVFFQKTFILDLTNDVYVIKYNPHERVFNKDNICFIVNNTTQLSTQLTKEDYLHVTFSQIKEDVYKKMAVNWFYDTNKVYQKGSVKMLPLARVLNLLSEIKKDPNYTNPSLTHLSNQEAILIKQYLTKIKDSTYATNSEIIHFKSFARWAIDANYITSDAMFMDYLSTYTHTFVSKAEAIPEEYIISIGKKLLEKSKQSLRWLNAYTIFHLLLQTEFRISQIVHLTIDCIHPAQKPGEYIIKSNSKTSFGQVNSFVITELTHKIIMEMIERTTDLRDETVITSLKDYVFVYIGKNGLLKLYEKDIFHRDMKIVCEELQLPKTYSAANLRDTHMTRAYEEIVRLGRTDLELSLLTKHKNIDTTKSHYLNIELDKMLEATYGITIGEDVVEANKKIVETIPDQFNNIEHEVENGCGNCSAENCYAINALPCMACKYFITTPKHAKFFEKALDMLEKNIATAKTIHDKEDLLKIKEFYALYLKAIYIHEEADNYELD